MRSFSAEDGAETVEFSLVILPLFGLIFLILSVAWVIFAKASLQYAVREGVRYAVTTHSTPDIKSVVQQQSFGFLAGTDGSNKISVTYTPSGNQGVNLVEISVSGVVVDPFGLAHFGLTPVTLSADSSDMMESAPPTS